MTPKGPSKSFHWPARDDVWWVPQDDILCAIAPPTTATGRTYGIDSVTLKNIIDKFRCQTR